MSVPTTLQGTHDGCGGRVIFRPAAYRSQLLSGEAVQLSAVCQECGMTLTTEWRLPEAAILAHNARRSSKQQDFSASLPLAAGGEEYASRDAREYQNQEDQDSENLASSPNPPVVDLGDWRLRARPSSTFSNNLAAKETGSSDPAMQKYLERFSDRVASARQNLQQVSDGLPSVVEASEGLKAPSLSRRSDVEPSTFLATNVVNSTTDERPAAPVAEEPAASAPTPAVPAAAEPSYELEHAPVADAPVIDPEPMFGALDHAIASPTFHDDASTEAAPAPVIPPASDASTITTETPELPTPTLAPENVPSLPAPAPPSAPETQVTPPDPTFEAPPMASVPMAPVEAAPMAGVPVAPVEAAPMAGVPVAPVEAAPMASVPMAPVEAAPMASVPMVPQNSVGAVIAPTDEDVFPAIAPSAAPDNAAGVWASLPVAAPQQASFQVGGPQEIPQEAASVQLQDQPLAATVPSTEAVSSFAAGADRGFNWGPEPDGQHDSQPKRKLSLGRKRDKKNTAESGSQGLHEPSVVADVDNHEKSARKVSPVLLVALVLVTAVGSFFAVKALTSSDASIPPADATAPAVVVPPSTGALEPAAPGKKKTQAGTDNKPKAKVQAPPARAAKTPGTTVANDGAEQAAAALASAGTSSTQGRSNTGAAQESTGTSDTVNAGTSMETNARNSNPFERP